MSFKFKVICEQFFAIKIHRFDEDNKKEFNTFTSVLWTFRAVREKVEWHFSNLNFISFLVLMKMSRVFSLLEIFHYIPIKSALRNKFYRSNRKITFWGCTVWLYGYDVTIYEILYSWYKYVESLLRRDLSLYDRIDRKQ